MCSTQNKGADNNNRGDTNYIFPFVPKNTRWYSEKWNVSSRSTHDESSRPHWMPYTNKNKGKTHPKIKQKTFSVGIPVFARSYWPR